jgi:tyrosyl-tRNA synthetase
MNLFEELKWRGMIKDISDEELAKKMLNDEKIVFYCGFDPSADSLTIGHAVQVVRSKLLQKYGHKPVILVGGATGLIGDPKETEERKLLTLEKSLENAKKIEAQLQRLMNYDGDNKAIIVNNYDWISKINMIEFLRDYGKHFSINYMLDKETIAKRLNTGISYTEFSYMILQAIDWLHLYRQYNCAVQFGGSDQWGNITAGLELIRKKEDGARVVALSSPLLLKADGTKFGKSEAGALWLDEEKTTPYEMYQYFINTSDKDVITYLKLLTLLSKEKIEELEVSLKERPEERMAQKVLSREILTFLYGKEAYEGALKISEALFNGDIKELTSKQIEEGFKDVPSLEIDKEMNIVDLLVEVGAASSKREAREFISNGAITVNGDKITDLEYIINENVLVKGKYIIIKRGKKNYYLIKYKGEN